MLFPYADTRQWQLSGALSIDRLPVLQPPTTPLNKCRSTSLFIAKYFRYCRIKLHNTNSERSRIPQNYTFKIEIVITFVIHCYTIFISVICRVFIPPHFQSRSFLNTFRNSPYNLVFFPFSFNISIPMESSNRPRLFQFQFNSPCSRFVRRPLAMVST